MVVLEGTIGDGRRKERFTITCMRRQDHVTGHGAYEFNGDYCNVIRIWVGAVLSKLGGADAQDLSSLCSGFSIWQWLAFLPLRGTVSRAQHK